MTIIDLLSRTVQFVPQLTRTAEESLETILNKLIYVKGVPLLFRTDEDKAFMSHVLGGMEQAVVEFAFRGSPPRRIQQSYLTVYPLGVTPREPSVTRRWSFRLPSQYSFIITRHYQKINTI